MINYNKKTFRRFLSITFTLVALFTVAYIQYKLKQDSAPAEQEAFVKIYREKKWGEGSGIGSWPENATPYLKIVQEYLYNPKYISIIDLGCGDWKLMETLIIPDDKEYVGYDLVESLIEANKKKYSKKNVKFYTISQLSDLKSTTGDLLLVKDVLHHWPNAHINYFLNSILPNFKNAIITNDFNEYATNRDIQFGDFRPINLESPPFVPIKGLKVVLDYPAHGIKKRIYLYEKP